MSWAITGDVLGVAALVLATFGTGAQAWANLAEYKLVRRSIADTASGAVADAALLTAVEILGTVFGSGTGRWHWAEGLAFYVKVFFRVIFFIPSNMLQISTKDGDKAVQLAQYLRLAVVWGVLMVSSALALAAACIQLALA